MPLIRLQRLQKTTTDGGVIIRKAVECPYPAIGNKFLLESIITEMFSEK